MTVDPYDRSEWDLCIVENCPNLFTDHCKGPGSCPTAQKRAHGIQIYIALEDKTHYVTTIARRH